MMKMSHQAVIVYLTLSRGGFTVMAMMMTIGNIGVLGLVASCTKFQVDLMGAKGATIGVMMVLEAMDGMWVNLPGVDTMHSMRNPLHQLRKPTRRTSVEHSDVSVGKKEVWSRQGLTRPKDATQSSSCNQKRHSLPKPGTCSNKSQLLQMPLSFSPRWIRAPMFTLLPRFRTTQR
jgi:hypothetical protein